MKLARQHLRVLKRWPFIDYEMFQPLTRFSMTRYEQEQKLGKRDWNTRKARGLCVDPWHFHFGVAMGEKCEQCGKPKGV